MMMMMMMMMAKPVKPKTLKPKTGGEAETEEGMEAEEGQATGGKASASKRSGGGGTGMLSIIVLSVVILLSSVAGPVAALYFLGPQLLAPIIAKASPPPTEGEEHGGDALAEGGEHGGGHEAVVKVSRLGLNLPLDEFTVNLKKDPTLRGTQYLRAKMNLSVLVPEAEDCSVQHKVEEAGHGGAAPAAEGGGHGAAPAAAVDPVKACHEAFITKMTAYIPTLRDIVNTALMKRSAAQIATLEGQELLKDEMSQEMNTILATNHYEVVRVNFEEFIVQR
jgi:flagellar basal body-associated protein FliL